MAYVGTPLDTTNAFQSLAGKRFNGDGSTTDFTLDSSPNSTLDIEVFVGNVRQDPNSAYTVSGTTLAFTGAPPSGTNNIYVVHQAKAVGTIDPAVGSTLDLNGAAELILDADADTTIAADTDDQIDIRVAGTDQLTIKDGALSPVTDNDIDLGTSSLEFKDAYFDGTVTSDAGLFDTLGIVAAKDLGVGLHIKSGDSGGDVHADADELVIEQAGAHVGMTFLNSGDNKQTINFGDAADNNVGQIEYEHGDNVMKLVTNQNERIRLLGTGVMDINVGGGTNNTSVWTMKVRQTANATATHYMIAFAKQNDTTVGSIQTDGSNTSYNTSSDYRLKENVVDLTGAIDRVKTLKPKRFNFKDNPSKTQDGFLAHEITAVPEAVNGAKDATETYTDDEGNEQTRILPQQLDQSKLVPLLTAAIIELEARVKTLEG